MALHRLLDISNGTSRTLATSLMAILVCIEPYVMICGRIVCAQSDDRIYDYVGCLYPEGMGKSDELIFFDRDAIEELYFIGYQDEYELTYRTEILDQLGELKVEDGELVEV